MILPASTFPVNRPPAWFDVFPTPQIACSLRQLNRNATQCINIGNSTNTVQQIIGFSNGYVDLTALTSFVAIHGTAFIVDWYNQNLESNVAFISQVVAGLRPQINPNTITENGYPAILFDGLDDQLQMYTNLGATTSITLPSQYSILMTSRNRNTTSNQGIGMMFSGFGSGSHAGLLCTFLGKNYLGDTIQGSSQVESTEDTKAFASFLGARLNSTTRKISINGIDETLTLSTYSVSGLVTGLGGYNVSPSRYSSANTTEVIYYDTDVQSFHSAMQANQQAAWGIT